MEYHKTNFVQEKYVWDYQAVAQVNYPNDYDFIRTTEHKKRYKTTKDLPHTIITKEYPRQWNIECYPVETQNNLALYDRYYDCISSQKDLYMLWRLAKYKYMDMWQIVRDALDFAEQWKEKKE